MTLVECLIALAVLSTALLGLLMPMNAGHQHQQYGERALHAVRLAEDLLEEIQGRPYSGHGLDRSSYHIDDYNAFEEHAGSLQDFAGRLYLGLDQDYDRSASITPADFTLAALNHAAIDGKLVTVTVRHSSGETWQLTRFIPAPLSGP